jgi:hypothetical protein
MAFEILMPNEGKWLVVPGHGCKTIEEAESYCAAFAGHFVLVKEGEERPPCPQPEPPKPMFSVPWEELTPEQAERRSAMLNQVLEKLREPLPS